MATSGLVVIPVRKWHRDCKDLFCTGPEEYVELGRHTSRKVTDSNAEL
jgi:hypothetical protein